MKRKKVLTIIGLSVVVVAAVVLSLALIFDWGIGGYRYEIALSATIYDEGEQEVDIYFTNNNEEATFKNTVTTSDISFEGDLRGRTVTKVEQDTSGIRLKITLGGKCSVFSTLSNRNKVIVSGNAVSDGRTYACVVESVKQSGVFAKENSDENGIYTSVFEMTSGSHFNEEYIYGFVTLINGDINTEIDVVFDIEEKTVTVTISNFEPSEQEEKPKVKFGAETTSLQREFIRTVG